MDPSEADDVMGSTGSKRCDASSHRIAVTGSQSQDRCTRIAVRVILLGTVQRIPSDLIGSHRISSDLIAASCF